MDLLDLPPSIRRHLAYAVRDRMATLRRNGITPPPELAELADLLAPPKKIVTRPETAAERAKRQDRERSRRYRARRRGEPVPPRRPGPSKIVTECAS